MKTLIEVLFKEEKLQKNSFVLDHTDGCAKQYRSATAMYLVYLQWHVKLQLTEPSALPVMAKMR